jgi:hypothetical protein
MMSATEEQPPPNDRRGPDRRRDQLADARARRWKGSTPESRRDFAKKLSAAAAAARQQDGLKTIVVSVRISAAAYDRYCQTALKARVQVRTVLQHILTMHAPGIETS